MPRAFHRVVSMGISSIFNSYEQFDDEDDPKNKSMGMIFDIRVILELTH
jgi:hypothetical protein